MPDKWGGIIYWRAAATFRDGMWWPVLEVPISGMPPFRVTRGQHGFSNHGAAYAQARNIIDSLDTIDGLPEAILSSANGQGARQCKRSRSE